MFAKNRILRDFVTNPKSVLSAIAAIGIVIYFLNIAKTSSIIESNSESSKASQLTSVTEIKAHIQHKDHVHQHVEVDDLPPLPDTSPKLPRENAAIVILARNGDREGLEKSLTEFEKRFNHKYNYPYVFLNNEEFDNNFKNGINHVISSSAQFGLIPKEHWSYPSWINQTYAKETRDQMEKDNVIYGGSESYRHMCRFNSGFFFMHPLLAQYDYYWRIEPDVHFFCDIDFDPFKFMRENNKKYSFVISFREFRSTIPTLWKTTKEYVDSRKIEPTWFKFFEDKNNGDYNLCHFWSNFEIADLRFFRSKQYLDYFQYLDSKGGFFYERWGDAPVHSLAVGLFLKKSEVHFFNDIGYEHPPYTHCPKGKGFESKCQCTEGIRLDETKDGSCVPDWLNYDTERDERKISDFDIFSGAFDPMNQPHPSNLTKEIRDFLHL
jgi:alpha 1,2-mannosyltransferase